MERFGVIFDMDEVLVQSRPALRKAAAEVLAQYGVRCRPEEFNRYAGMGEDAMIGGVAASHGLAYDPEMKRRAYQIYGRIAPRQVKVYPGARPALRAVKAAGFCVAVASSADREKVEVNLRLIGAADGFFGAVVTGSDVARKKPDPSIFLLAARRLALPPGRCVVVEDALSGVRAAHAAGMACVAVQTSYDAETLRSRAAPDRIVPDIASVPKAVEALCGRPAGAVSRGPESPGESGNRVRL